jgi:hypothetical protein
MPVILVVYNAMADAAYWLYVQAYLASHPRVRSGPQQGRSLSESRRATYWIAAIRQFAAWKNGVLEQTLHLVHHHE